MRRAGSLAIAALVLGYASVAHGGGENQFAHLALVRSLAEGTAIVDPYRPETKDLSWFEGHYYSTKAPGLALLTVGPYFVLERTGLLDALADVTGAEPKSIALWILGLIGAVLPTAVLLVLLRRVSDDFEPGFGTIGAVTAGLCTLLFPFATLFFDHALAAALGFAAFAAVWYAGRQAWMIGLAGLLAGFGITSEYPLGLVALAVGAYVLLGHDRVRRGAWYAAGAALGFLPLVLYNWWAFGSPLHISYEHAIVLGGVTGHDVLGANDEGFFGVTIPDHGVGMHLLFGKIGLLTVTPVVLAGAAGLVLLWRKGLRREAALAGFLSVAYLVYNAGYASSFGAFGGGTPGPRFLIPMLPFLALGFAQAYRRWPWTTLALAAPSGLVMLGATATDPVWAKTWAWFDRVVDGSLAGSGVWPRLPLALCVLAAVVLCARATPIGRPSLRQAIGFLLTLAVYVGIAVAGPRLVGTNPRLLLVLFVAGVAVVALWHLPSRRSEPPPRHAG